MKFVFASERGKLLRERQLYIDDYNTRKATHEAQVEKYQTDTENYTENIKDFVVAFLSAELAQLPGVILKVDEARDNEPLARRYYIYMRYQSQKRANKQEKWTDESYSYGVESGRLKGFGWTFTIYLSPQKQEDGSYINVVKKAPLIEANALDSNDYFELKATYDLFSKIDTIDWNAVISHISNSAPKKEDIITEPDPGYFSTHKWDSKIAQYEINRIIGKDLWLKVRINREDSYDRYNSNNAGVDGQGWVKINSQTDKFYIFNWLGCRYNDDEIQTWEPSYINSQMRHEYRLKKIYFEPIQPIQYATTDDLTQKVKPDYLADVPEDDN